MEIKKWAGSLLAEIGRQLFSNTGVLPLIKGCVLSTRKSNQIYIII
jgi:hypothetical protein